jgi:Rod binding domain-containing protein
MSPNFNSILSINGSPSASRFASPNSSLSSSLPTANPVFGSGISSPLLADQTSFSKVLSRENSRISLDPKAKARDAAEQFVAIALVQPLFKQLRASQNSTPPFGASNGEKQFRALWDAEIAQRMVHRSRWPLVDRVAQGLLKQSSTEAATK